MEGREREGERVFNGLQRQERGGEGRDVEKAVNCRDGKGRVKGRCIGKKAGLWLNSTHRKNRGRGE